MATLSDTRIVSIHSLASGSPALAPRAPSNASWVKVAVRWVWLALAIVGGSLLRCAHAAAQHVRD